MEEANKSGEGSTPKPFRLLHRPQDQPELTAEGSNVIETVDPNEGNAEDDVIDPFLVQALLKTPQDRLLLLKLDKDLELFLNDPKRSRLEFPPMSSYHRMIVHKAAAYFGLSHKVDPTGKFVIVGMLDDARVPDLRFTDLIEQEDDSASEKSVKILRRETSMGQSEANTTQNTGLSGAKNDDKKSRTIEEREEAYLRARARIFAESNANSVQSGGEVPVLGGSNDGGVGGVGLPTEVPATPVGNSGGKGSKKKGHKEKGQPGNQQRGPRPDGPYYGQAQAYYSQPGYNPQASYPWNPAGVQAVHAQPMNPTADPFVPGAKKWSQGGMGPPQGVYEDHGQGAVPPDVAQRTPLPAQKIWGQYQPGYDENTASGWSEYPSMGYPQPRPGPGMYGLQPPPPNPHTMGMGGPYAPSGPPMMPGLGGFYPSGGPEMAEPGEGEQSEEGSLSASEEATSKSGPFLPSSFQGPGFVPPYPYYHPEGPPNPWGIPQYYPPHPYPPPMPYPGEGGPAQPTYAGYPNYQSENTENSSYPGLEGGVVPGSSQYGSASTDQITGQMGEVSIQSDSAGEPKTSEGHGQKQGKSKKAGKQQPVNTNFAPRPAKEPQRQVLLRHPPPQQPKMGPPSRPLLGNYPPRPEFGIGGPAPYGMGMAPPNPSDPNNYGGSATFAPRTPPSLYGQNMPRRSLYDPSAAEKGSQQQTGSGGGGLLARPPMANSPTGIAHGQPGVRTPPNFSANCRGAVGMPGAHMQQPGWNYGPGGIPYGSVGMVGMHTSPPAARTNGMGGQTGQVRHVASTGNLDSMGGPSQGGTLGETPKGKKGASKDLLYDYSTTLNYVGVDPNAEVPVLTHILEAVGLPVGCSSNDAEILLVDLKGAGAQLKFLRLSVSTPGAPPPPSKVLAIFKNSKAAARALEAHSNTQYSLQPWSGPGPRPKKPEKETENTGKSGVEHE